MTFPIRGSGSAITICLRFLVVHSHRNRNSLVKQETDTYGYTKYGIMETTQCPSTYPLALRRRFHTKVISSLHGMVHPSVKFFGLRMVHIYDEGFDIDQSHTDDEDEPCAVCISMPKSLFTDSNLENLKALIAAKGGLIKKALGVADLPLEITDTKVSFPWFPATPTPDEMKAYDTFICKLCEMARNQSRVNSSEKPIENEKYAFRCFLLRLGFIGDEYKAARKILLKNLSGSSAFRNGGAQHEISE